MDKRPNNIGTIGLSWDDKLECFLAHFENKAYEVRGCSDCKQLQIMELYSYAPANMHCLKGHDGEVITANFYTKLKDHVVATIFRQPLGECVDYEPGRKPSK